MMRREDRPSCVLAGQSCRTDPAAEAQGPTLLAGRHAADLSGVFGPRLQVLQREQRAVLQAQRVRCDRLVDGLLEGLLLQLHEDPVGLLPLRLPLLRGLPSATAVDSSRVSSERG